MYLLQGGLGDTLELKNPRTYDKSMGWQESNGERRQARKERGGGMNAQCGHVFVPLHMDMHVEREHHMEVPRVVKLNKWQRVFIMRFKD